MAEQITVTLVDDLDESVAATQTVAFSLDGTVYEIDLCDSNAEQLRTMLGQWAVHGRRVGRARSRSRTHQPEQPAQTPPEAIRRWAKNNGYQVNHRGRLPTTLIEAYRRAES